MKGLQLRRVNFLEF